MNVFMNQEKVARMCKMVSMTINNRSIMVADLKVDAINNAIDKISELKEISKAILFGSALEERCTEDSDIDIALFGEMTENRFFSRKDVSDFKYALAKGCGLREAYDILYFQNKDYDSDSLIMIEIREKGQTIYGI